MNKSKWFFFMAISLIANTVLAQNEIIVKVRDFDTHQPIPCARVSIEPYEENDTIIFTDKAGMYSMDLYEDVFITITANGYHSREIELEDENIIEGADNFEDIDIIDDTVLLYLYGDESESFKFEDIASDDNFDFNLGFEVFSPQMASSDTKFKSVFSAYYAYELKTKIANNFQFGFRYEPIKLKWMAMNNDTLLTKTPHQKERYFEASTSIDFYLRYIFSVQGVHKYRGLYLDLGAGYTLPYYFSYTFFTEILKSSRNNIHNFKDFSAMARLGFSWGSVKATYRFTDILKDDFIQPPKLTLGVDFNIPMN